MKLFFNFPFFLLHFLLQECASLVRSCHVQLQRFLNAFLARAAAAAALRKGLVAVVVIIVVVAAVFIVVVAAAVGEYYKLLLIDLFFSQAAIRRPSALRLERYICGSCSCRCSCRCQWQIHYLPPVICNRCKSKWFTIRFACCTLSRQVQHPPRVCHDLCPHAPATISRLRYCCVLYLLDTDTHQCGQNWVTACCMLHAARCCTLHVWQIKMRWFFRLRVQRSLKRLKRSKRSLPIDIKCVSSHHVLRLPNWGSNWSIVQLVNWSIRRQTMACKLQRGALKAFTTNTHNVSQGYFCPVSSCENNIMIMGQLIGQLLYQSLLWL